MRWNRDEWISAQEYVEQSIENGSDPGLYIYSFLFADNNADPSGTTPSNLQCDLSLFQRAYRLGVGLRPPTDKIIPYLDHAGDIQLLSKSIEDSGGHALFHGTIMDSTRANVRFAKEWIMECESRHRGLCEKQSLNIVDAHLVMPPEDLFAIDVQRMCLVLLLKQSRYVALSYCWLPGSEKTLVTTESNKAELLVENSLKSRFL